MLIPVKLSLMVLLALLGESLSAAETGVINCVASSSTSGAETEARKTDCSNYLPDASRWRFGLSAGYGRRSNPLINSDDIPLYGMLQLSYTGENFFFDNGDIGYFLRDSKNWELNLIAGVGGERSFYSFLNSSSFSFIPESISASADLGLGRDEAVPGSVQGETLPPETVTVRIEAPDRDYTVDAGLEWIYNFESSDVQIQAITDLSGRHKGQELWLSWSRPIEQGNLRLTPSAGFTWKSSRSANYFYGVRDDEARTGFPEYRADSAFNPFVRLTASYRIDQHWSLVSVLHYESLADNITDSPSVVDDYVTTGYLGIYYEF